jgi:hypothetical protein
MQPQKSTGKVAVETKKTRPTRARTLVAGIVLSIGSFAQAQTNTIKFANSVISLSQNASTVGGSAPQDGNFTSPSGGASATLAPASAQTSYSYSSPSQTYNLSASAGGSGSFNTQIGSSGGTFNAVASTSASGSGTCIINEAPCSGNGYADGVAEVAIQTYVTVTASTYYLLTFQGPVLTDTGGYSNGARLDGWFGNGLTGNQTLSGTLNPGITYIVTGTAQSGADECSGCLHNASNQFMLMLTLSNTPIALTSNSAPTDGPLPLWAFGALGAGLIGIASRRLTKAS